jgi:hypothetical protein
LAAATKARRATVARIIVISQTLLFQDGNILKVQQEL